MKFLLSIGSAEMSRDTIIFGGRIAAAFNADLSVLYVSTDQPKGDLSGVNMSRQKLSEWQIDLPGVKVLEYAEAQLKDMEIIDTTEKGKAVEVHALKPDVHGAYELHAMGRHGENIRLRLREGEIVDQIKREVELGGYDIAIMGASKERRLIDRIIQFVDCSLFITKNIKDIEYKFLFCVDGTDLSRKALYLGTRAAAFYKAETTLLMVVRTENDIPEAEAVLERSSYVLNKKGVNYRKKVIVGDPLEVILEEAGEDHIVVMGSSRSSALRKFFRPTKSVKLVQRGNSPVLIAK